MPQIPEGYYLVEDENYVIQTEDRYYFVTWKSSLGYERIFTYFRLAIGITIQEATKLSGAAWGNRMFVITKYPPKPKFPTDKPYPFGY